MRNSIKIGIPLTVLIVVGGVAMYWNQILVNMGISIPTNPQKSLDARENDERGEFDPVITYTSRTIQNCIGSVCTIEIVEYDRFFYNQTNTTWVEINESFFECGTAFCTPEYRFQAVVEDNTKVTTSIGGTRYSTRILDIRNQSMNTAFYAKDNEVIFPNIINNTDLHYTYFPDRLKETFVFKRPPVFARGETTLNITYENIGDPILTISEEVLCDARGQCHRVPVFNNRTNIIVPIPASYFNDSLYAYPLELDPSQAFNGSPNNTFSGYIRETTIFYARFPDPPGMRVGRNESIGSVNFETYRSILEFNISTLPTAINITDVKLRLAFTELGNNDQNIINYTSMENNNFTYPNDDAGNRLYFIDAGNGTTYNVSQVLDTGITNINLTKAAPDILSSVSKGWWGVGIKSVGDDSGASTINVSGVQSVEFQSRTFAAVNGRPMLNITFSFPINCPPIGTKWVITTLCEINSGVFTVTHLDIISPGWLVLNTAQINGLKHLTMTAGARQAALTIKSGGFT